VHVQVNRSPIKIRVVGGPGLNSYAVQGKPRLQVYDEPTGFASFGNGKMRKHLSSDIDHLEPAVSNRYHKTMPLLAIGYNLDDGLLLGLGVRHIHQGFRKTPYASMQSLQAQHSLSTDAYRIRYYGEWHQLMGKAGLRIIPPTFLGWATIQSMPKEAIKPSGFTGFAITGHSFSPPFSGLRAVAERLALVRRCSGIPWIRMKMCCV
jgi:hypothetical protein